LATFDLQILIHIETSSNFCDSFLIFDSETGTPRIHNTKSALCATDGTADLILVILWAFIVRSPPHFRIHNTKIHWRTPKVGVLGQIVVNFYFCSNRHHKACNLCQAISPIQHHILVLLRFPWSRSKSRFLTKIERKIAVGLQCRWCCNCFSTVPSRRHRRQNYTTIYL